MDAAEALFAASGFADTSIRGITEKAGVNIAAIHYHFGSKDGLIEAVFARRLAPLNEHRLEMLDALERREAPPVLGEILEAFLRPVFERLSPCSGGVHQFVQLYGRTLTEPSDALKNILATQFRNVVIRFRAALANALPHLDEKQLDRRLLFTIGVMAHTISSKHTFEIICRAGRDEDPSDALMHDMIDFCEAGFAGRDSNDGTRRGAER